MCRPCHSDAGRLPILKSRNSPELTRGESRMAIEPIVRDETTQAVPIEAVTPVGSVDEVATPSTSVAEQALPEQSVAAERSESSEQPGRRTRTLEHPVHNLHVSDWLFRSREASFLWLVVRFWLGYQWTNAAIRRS